MSALQVIGDPVLHSKSPLLHGAMLRELGLDVPYTAHVVKKGELPAYLAWAADNGITGFNATMPHKEDLLPLLDGLDDSAARCGAANTVARRKGKWIGFNTDGPGCLEALKEAGMDPAGRTVLVLGAGGAARAVGPALAAGGADQVLVANRNLARAQALCGDDPRLSPAPFDLDTLRRLAGQSGLIVNCTSLGMADTPSQFGSFNFLDTLPHGAGVFDLIYHPAETELLRQARLRGHPAANGLGMLVWQAVLALEIFLNQPLDRPRMAAAARAALN